MSECTDELAYMYDWEDLAARDVGLRTCAASPEVDCPKGDCPMMPCVPAEEDHREKVVKVARIINAMVSRPVGRAEMFTNTKAMDSVKKEWKGLIDQGVFDLSVIREYYDVAREAKQKNEEVRMARAPGTIVEKHSQLSEEDPRRKYKGRGVVLGNQIKRTRRCFKIWGILLQLSKPPDGPIFWVALTDGMCRWLMRRRHMSKPHYGVHLVGSSFHPKPFLTMTKNDGISSKDRAMGFEPVGEEWPSVYTHPELQLVLVVYVGWLVQRTTSKRVGSCFARS